MFSLLCVCIVCFISQRLLLEQCAVKLKLDQGWLSFRVLKTRTRAKGKWQMTLCVCVKSAFFVTFQSKLRNVLSAVMPGDVGGFRGRSPLRVGS